MLQAIFPEKNKKSFLEKLEKSKNLRYHVHQSNLLSTSNLSIKKFPLEIFDRALSQYTPEFKEYSSKINA